MVNSSYWLLVPFVASSLVAIVFALLWRNESIERRILTEDFHGEAAQCDRMEQERDTAIAELRRMDGDIERYIEENKQLKAEKADILDALQDARAEIKSLNMQTKEMPEIPAPPARVKRTAVKKVIHEP